jgi:hypothetical protein
MANFIPNFNAPSQNYGNILNMSYRRGMDPRKRRRIASGRPAGTQVITNPDGTQVSVSGQTARQASNAARRESRAKRVSEVAASQKRTKPSDILLSPAEQKSRQMTRARSLADRFYENQFAEAIGQARARNNAPAPFIAPSQTPEGRAAFQSQMESQWQSSPQRAILEQGRLAQENIAATQDEYRRRDAARAAERASANQDVFRAQQGVAGAEAAQRRSADAWADTQIQNTLNQPSGMFGNLKPSDVFEAAAMSPAVVPYTLYELLKRMG